MNGHRVQTCPLDVVLFRATGVELRAGAVAPDDLGWRDVAPDRLEIHYVPSDHLDMLKPPHVHAVAEGLRRTILRTDSEHSLAEE